MVNARAPDVLEELFRAEWPVLVAAAARIVGDVGAAEELVQDVLVAALARWPFTGVPDRPGAWLMTATRNRARNRRRDDARARARLESAAVISVEDAEPSREPIDDDRLRLMFICAHPVLPAESQTALTLRLVAGLSTRAIARGLMRPEATVAQRIVRAKRLLADARVPFTVPAPDDWDTRLPTLLRVLYLIFTEGHTAAEGAQLAHPELCEEAIRLARLLADLVPETAEAHALVALMEYQASRLATRVDVEGDLVVLADQDRAGWDRHRIRAGDVALAAARTAGPPGRLSLQAAIAAEHAHARTWEATDWGRIVALYDALAEIDPSPIVALNRGVAVAMADGATAGLVLVDALVADGELADLHLLWATRADLLRRAGRPRDAIADYNRALGLTVNAAERRYLAGRRDECADHREAAP